MLRLISDSKSGLDPVFEKGSGFDPGCHIWYQSQVLERLMHQVADGGDTKAGGIIPQWQEVRRWGHEASWYYPTMAREFPTSTIEVEYIAAGSCCAQILWMKNQLLDYGLHVDKIPIFCDNTSAIAITENLVQHSRTKHIDIKYHFIREHVMNGTVELHFLPSEQQLAYIFTKPLDESTFSRNNLNDEMPLNYMPIMEAPQEKGEEVSELPHAISSSMVKMSERSPTLDGEGVRVGSQGEPLMQKEREIERKADIDEAGMNIGGDAGPSSSTDTLAWMQLNEQQQRIDERSEKVFGLIANKEKSVKHFTQLKPITINEMQLEKGDKERVTISIKHPMLVDYSPPKPDEDKLMGASVASFKTTKDAMLRTRIARIYRYGKMICVMTGHP
ncbi:hypothetical protein AgCh_008038 [Apium graveolens]